MLNTVVKLHSQEAEQSLLSLALRNPTLIALCADSDFYISDNAIIWRAVNTLTTANMSIDPVTVNNHVIKETGRDLFDYLADIYGMEVPEDHADTYRKIIKEHAYSRLAVSTSDKMKQLSSSALSSTDKSASIGALINELDAYAVADYEPMSIGEAVMKQGDNLEKMAEGTQMVVMTGYHELDQITGGLLGGDFIVIAGRPGMGKTALALNIAENYLSSEHAIENNMCVPFFSLEMTATQLGGRYACSIGEIDSKKMRSGDLTEAEWNRYSVALNEAMKHDLVIDDRPGISMEDIKQACLKLVRQGKKLGMVFIDYLQIIKRMRESGYESVTEISGQMKALAKLLGVPVIALSQLSRDVEKRADKRPVSSDLRESGAIEQDADLILFTYRDEVYHPDTPNPGIAEIIVPKNRGGEPGTAVLKFQGKYSRFVDNVDEIENDRWI